MTEIIKSACDCGEPILIETGLQQCFRADGKRPHYAGSHPASTQLRCKKCGGWLMDTCVDAKYEGDLSMLQTETAARR